LRLIVKSLAAGMEDEIAEFENRAALALGNCYAEPVSGSEARAWFSSDEVKPEEFALALLDGRIAGYAWAWIREGDSTLSFTGLKVDPLLPADYALGVARALLSWARLSLEEWQGARGVVSIQLGLFGGWLMELLKRLLPGLEEFRVSSILMRLEDPGVLSRGGVVEELNPAVDREDAAIVSRIYNDAFSRYEAFIAWSEDDVEEYYREKARRHPVIVLMARRGGEPAGFVEVYPYTSICGEKIGYVSLLAVAGRHQGRGIGTLLLAEGVRRLEKHGVRETILHALPEVARLYYKLGFRPVRWYVKSRIPIGYLPGNIPSMETLNAS